MDPTVDLTKLMLQQDDLLIVRTNGSRDLIGRAAVVQSGIRASFASYLIRYQLDTTAVRPEWVRIMLDTPKARATVERLAASSAGQYNLGLKKLNGLEIPQPSLEEQDRLLARYGEREWQNDTLSEQLETADAKGKALRGALLATAFTGRLTAHARNADLLEEMVGV